MTSRPICGTRGAYPIFEVYPIYRGAFPIFQANLSHQGGIEVGEFDGVYGPKFEFFRSGGVAVFVGVRLSPPLYGVQGPTPNTLHPMMIRRSAILRAYMGQTLNSPGAGV